MNELFTLFITFFKIGAFTFGGGYAMIPMIIKEITEHGWLTKEIIFSFIGISESTPGPFAVNIATFVGLSVGGIPSAICATLGVVLPSFIIILIIAKLFASFSENPYVKAALNGLRPAVIGLIAAAAVSIAGNVLLSKNNDIASVFNLSLPAVGITAITAFALYKKTHPVSIILISALCGLVIYSFF